MILALLVVYIGVATIVAVTHKTLRVTYEDYNERMAQYTNRMYGMESWIYQEVDSDGKKTCEPRSAHWAYFEIKVTPRVFAGLFWPWGITKLLLRFIFTDHNAP